MPYAELEVGIEQVPGGSYVIDMRYRADPSDLDRDLVSNVSVQIDNTSLLARSIDVDAYGEQLSQTIFGDRRLREAWITARATAEARNLPLRLRLRLDPGDPELHGIRWETVFDDQHVALARSERFLLSRYLESGDMTPFLAPEREDLRALVITSNPANLASFGLAGFDAQAEADRIVQALGDIPAVVLAGHRQGNPLTAAHLIATLRDGYSIVYLVCHGQLRNGIAYLALEDEQGNTNWVRGDLLAERIRDFDSRQRPALMVLASCQSVGIGQDSDVPAALGPQLARAGVAAVIGMQGNVPQSLVAALMPRFFEQLVIDGQIDRALAAARSNLPRDEPWWMPVLFLRNRDGRLWRDPPVQVIQPKPLPRKRFIWPAAGVALLLLIVMFVFRPFSVPEPEEHNLGLVAAITPSAAVMPSVTPTSAPPTPTSAPPTPTSAPPTTTPMPEVAPVAEGKYMVLVADLEQQAAQPRDYARDLFEDLQLNIEAIPFSEVEIRRYRQVIASDAEARAVAEGYGATVMVWGRYDDSRISLRVQIGDRTIFPNIPAEIDPTILARTANLSLRISTAESPLPSPALAVLTVLNVLETANGDGFGTLRIVTLQERLKGKVTLASVEGQSTAAFVNYYIARYFDDPADSLQATDQAIANDPSNPLLYTYRAAVQQRVGNYAAALEDILAAERLVPGWVSPTYLKAVNSYVANDLAATVSHLDLVLAQRPDDWLALGYRGGLHYLIGNFDAARIDLNRSIEQNPATSLPYGYALVLALREARIADAQALVADARVRFAGQQNFDTIFYSALFGQENVIGVAASTFDLLLAYQYADAIIATDRALTLSEGLVLPSQISADLYFMRGFAQCNSGDLSGASESYTEALARSANFTLVHLLRADVRLTLGDGLLALEDLNAVMQSPQAAQFEPILQAAQQGQLTCRNILEESRS